MMLLDNERLAALEDEFNEHPDGIELANFVWLMECAINYPVEEKVDLVYGLMRLFKDIDINGDLHMEWSEFTQYIIDCVLEEGVAARPSSLDSPRRPGGVEAAVERERSDGKDRLCSAAEVLAG